MMKRFLALALIFSLLFPATSWGAYVLVDDVAIGNAGTPDPPETSAAIDTTGADFIVCGQASYSTSVDAPTDNKANTWPALSSNINDVSANLFFATNVSGKVGAGHTFTANAYQASLICAAFSGSHTTAPADQDRSDAYTSYAANLRDLATGSITPSEDNELIIAFWATSDVSGATGLVDSGFTLINSVDQSANHMGSFMAYKIQTTATAVNPIGSWTGQSSASAVIASFKAAPVGGAAPTAQFRRRQ